MCSTRPITEESISSPDQVIGLDCPLCGDSARLEYMKFRDPHGVDRIDPELFECSLRKHSYTASTRGLRLLASEGKLAHTDREFTLVDGKLTELSVA